MEKIDTMDKKTFKLFIEQKELEVQLNLENNYKEEAYKNFCDYRDLVNKYLEEGYINEKKFAKTFGKRVERWEEIFEPKEDEETEDTPEE